MRLWAVSCKEIRMVMNGGMYKKRLFLRHSRHAGAWLQYGGGIGVPWAAIDAWSGGAEKYYSRTCCRGKDIADSHGYQSR